MENRSIEATKKMKMQPLESWLPLSLIESEILPKVPARSIGRFKSVCKRWKSLLSTRSFARMHLDYHVTINDDGKLLLVDGIRFLTLPITDTEVSTTIHCNPNPDPQFIVASLDGLVCLASGDESTKLAFWNPLTGAYKKLSLNPGAHLLYYCSYDAVGFYRDSCNDYKLLYLMNVGDCGAYIYSHRLDSWREIEFSVENASSYTQRGSCRCSNATFYRKSLYFTVRNRSNGSWILCFDVDTEKFREIRFPPVPSTTDDYWGNLVVLDGCIHLCVAYKINTDDIVMHGDLWRMDGDDDGHGWVKVTSQHTSNGNWPAILKEFATHTDYSSLSSWAYRSSRTIYVETLVSPS